MSEHYDVAFDIETLALGPRAIVLSVGIVPFSRREREHFEVLIARGVRACFPVREQVRAGRELEDGTLGFWFEQPDAARAAALTGWPWGRALYELSQLGVDRRARWWCCGPHFDAANLEGVLADLALGPAPFAYDQVRDVRTLLELAEIGKFEPDGFIAHDPVHDAARDALAIQAALGVR